MAPAALVQKFCSNAVSLKFDALLLGALQGVDARRKKLFARAQHFPCGPHAFTMQEVCANSLFLLLFIIQPEVYEYHHTADK